MEELPESPLPEEPAYWEGLAARIREDAEGPLRAYAAGAVWYAPVARRAPWLVAASVLAIAALWLTLPRATVEAERRWVERVLAPDEAAAALVGPAPPGIGDLVPLFPPGFEPGARR